VLLLWLSMGSPHVISPDEWRVKTMLLRQANIYDFNPNIKKGFACIFKKTKS